MKGRFSFLVLCVLALFPGPAFCDFLDEARYAAENGDVNAQFELGNRLYFGLGTKADHLEAAKWFRRAALAGDPHAVRELERKARGYDMMALIREAEMGDYVSQFSLGTKFYFGRGIRKDFSEAARWFRAAAMRGCPVPPGYPPPLPPGKYYPYFQYAYKGNYPQNWNPSFPQGPEVTIEQLKVAAEAGDPHSQFLLGTRFLMGTGNEKSFIQAAGWLKRAADRIMTWPPNVPSINSAKRQNNVELGWGAQSGDIGARYELGNRFYFGEGVGRDYEKAAFWYREAYLQGAYTPGLGAYWNAYRGFPDRMAMKASFPQDAFDLYEHGMRFIHGDGVSVDEDEAVKHLSEAAKRAVVHDSPVMSGKSVGQVKDMAEKGDTGAMYELGKRFHEGQGVPKSTGEACRWFALACERSWNIPSVPLPMPLYHPPRYSAPEQ